MSLDNFIWQGGITVFQHNKVDPHSEVMPLNDQALYHLINLGGWDMDAIDKPWDVSTCAMCFTTCVADQLWTIIEREQARVGAFCFFIDYETECSFLE